MSIEIPEEIIQQIREEYEKLPDILLDGTAVPEKARLGDLFWNMDEKELYICTGKIDGKWIWRKVLGKI